MEEVRWSVGSAAQEGTACGWVAKEELPELLGHADPRMTSRYAQVVDRLSQDSAASFSLLGC